MSQTPLTDLNGAAAGVDLSVPNDGALFGAPFIYFTSGATTGTDSQQPTPPPGFPNLVTNSTDLKSMSISIPVSELVNFDSVADGSDWGFQVDMSNPGTPAIFNISINDYFECIVTTANDVRTLTFYSCDSIGNRQSAPLANYETLLDSLYFKGGVITRGDTEPRNLTVTYTDTSDVIATPAVLRINGPVADTTSTIDLNGATAGVDQLAVNAGTPIYFSTGTDTPEYSQTSVANLVTTANFLRYLSISIPVSELVSGDIFGDRDSSGSFAIDMFSPPPDVSQHTFASGEYDYEVLTSNGVRTVTFYGLDTLSPPPPFSRESKPPATYEDLLDALYFQNTTADTAQRNFTVTYTDTFGVGATSAVLRINAPDTTPPVRQSATTSADGTKIILTYDEALHANSLDAGSFTVTVGGAPRNVTGVVVNGSTVELMLASAITNGQAVDVRYITSLLSNPIEDIADNDASFIDPAVSVTNNVPVASDTTAPAFVSAATSTGGTKVILTYDEALSATTAATTDFVVNVGGSPVTVKSVVVNGLTVELTLQLPVTSAQAVTVAYTDPNTGSNDTNAVQDAAGNDAVSFTAADVTNNLPTSPYSPNISLLPNNEARNKSATFTEVSGPDNGSAAVAFSGTGTSLTDTDSANLVNLRVSIPVAQVATGDQLLLGATVIDLTSTTATGSVTYGGDSFSYSMVDVSGARTVIFTGSAPKASYELLLDALKYNNTSDTPVNGSTRALSVNISDGTNNAFSAATLTVTISANTADDDATAPTASATTATITSAGNAVVQSTEIGTAYLVKSTVAVTDLASITNAADANWNQVSITAANTDTNLAATGLSEGTYTVYAVDAAGNLSIASTNSVVVDAPPHGTRDGAPSFAAPVINAYDLTDVGNYAHPSFADINGDGKLDAIIGRDSGDIWVYLNTGTTTAPAFAEPLINPYGLTNLDFHVSTSLADINGDGKLDVFVGGVDGNTRVYLNTGTTTAPAFGTPTTNPYGLTNAGSLLTNYARPSLADIDADSDLDAFVGNREGNTLVFLNTGSTTNPVFATPVTNAYGLTDVGDFARPNLADIDGDGDLDAFIGDGNGDTRVYINTGSATNPAFGVPVTTPYSLTNVGSHASPSLADIDGDGDLDAFIGGQDGNTHVYINVGGFEAPVTSSTANGTYGVGSVITLTVALNKAVIVDTTNGSPTLLLETGMTDRAATYVSGSGTTSLTFTYTVQAGDTSADLDIASAAALALNGSTIKDTVGNDAILTLAAPGAAGSLAAAQALVVDAIAPHTKFSAPSFGAPVANRYGLTTEGASYSSPTFVDIDGDGDLDAFIGYKNGNTWGYINTGSATNPVFTSKTENPYGLDNVGSYASPSFADINGDGKLDAFIGSENGDTLVYLNTGSATVPNFSGTPLTNPYGLTNVGSYASPSFADINGDGLLDAFIGNEHGSTQVYLNTGSATAPEFAEPVVSLYGLTDVGDYATPSLADIDGDGDLDAFIGDGNGNTRVFINTGSATSPAFAAPVTNPYGLTQNDYCARPSLADIDGDGDLDAFIGGESDTWVFINESDFVAPVTSSTANGTYGVGSVITLTVTFNEAVYVVGGTPTLLLETGATDRAATYVSGSGTTSLTFTYTVQAGDTSADLDIASAAALALNGSTIQDAAGNNAILTLATPGAPASLAAAKALVIGTTAPADPPAPTPDPEPTPAPAPEPVVPAPAPAPAPATNTETIDGTTVQTGTTSQTNSSGQTINTTTQTVTPVSNSRPEDPGTAHGALADIPLVKDSTGQPVLTVSLPVGVGVVSESIDNNRLTLREKLILASDPRIALPADFQKVLGQGIDQYVPSVNNEEQVTVRTITLTMPTAATAGAPTLPIVITGASGTGEGDSTHPQRQEALVIDARQLPSGTVLQFDKVEFAIIIGPSTVLGGEGRNFVIGDGSSQTIVLGPDDDVLRGGDGNDTIGSKGGDDQLFGDAGNDWVVGGIGNDTLQGGDGNDILQGGASDAGTWTFKLNTQGQLQANFIPSSTELADSTGFAATGQWTIPAGQPGFVSDERVHWVYSDYSVVKDLALLAHALVGRLPTLSEMGAFAGGQFSSQQLGDMVNDYFARTHNIQTQTLDTQLSTVINQVWGSNASTPALVNLGKDYLAAGGTWADIWLALARHNTNANSITDAQGNVSLINQTLGETGWSANPGNNQLSGGAGNDVITGGAGSNLIDGGTGTDMAVYVGTPNDYQIALTPSTEAGAIAGAHDALIRNKFTGAVDTVRNVELLKMGAAVYTVPFDQFQPTNNVYVELADYVQLTEQNLVLVGFVPAQLV